MGVGSGIRNPVPTYPKKTNSGTRIQGQKGTGSRIRIRNTGWYGRCVRTSIVLLSLNNLTTQGL
jgi:hypothetical protein